MAVIRLFGFLLALFCFSHYREVVGGMTGGISPVNMSDENVMKDIQRGLGIYLKKENKELTSDGADVMHCVTYREICGTLRASSQVVQGTLYRVAVEIVPMVKDFSASSCVQKDILQKLPFLKRGKEKLVCFTVWSRSWLEKGSEGFIVEKKDSNDYKSCLEVNT